MVRMTDEDTNICAFFVTRQQDHRALENPHKSVI